MSRSRLAGLLVLSSVISSGATGQHLFGNPTCEAWQKLTLKEKTVWLNAYLAPLNLTHVARKKPKIDKFSQLSSLDSAATYVDRFCNDHPTGFASMGAIRFLDELTLDD